jgi:hypothetical protein
MHGTDVPDGGRHSTNAHDVKFDHSLGSIYSRGVCVLSNGRASSSQRPPAALSKSVVGMAAVVCFVGAAATDRVSTLTANYCTIFVSNCSWCGCYSGASPDATG